MLGDTDQGCHTALMEAIGEVVARVVNNVKAIGKVPNRVHPASKLGGKKCSVSRYQFTCGVKALELHSEWPYAKQLLKSESLFQGTAFGR